MALWPFLFLFNNVIYGALISKIMTFSLFPTYRLRFWQRQYLIPVYIYIYIYKKKVIDHTFMSIIFWSFKVLKIAKVFFFWAKDKQHVYPIYMERNKSFNNTHFYFWIRKLQIFQNNFLSYTLTIYCFLLLTKYLV